MTYAPFPITDFHGLDLRSEADATGGAIDGVNFDLIPGAVKSRPGSKLFTTPPNSPTAVIRMRPFYLTAGDQLLAHYTVSGGSKVTAFNAVGTTVATQAMAAASSVCDFASLGTASAQRAYVCDSAGPMFRWSGSAFTSIAGSPRCSYLTTTPDFRLVAAKVATLPTGSGAASASSSLVHISDPGAPETWSPNNYLYLSPGDGDDITGVVSWQNLWFVFKRFKFFVFYGTSVDSAGEPVFDYRTIESRVSPQTPFSAVAAPEGVYFVSGDGVYITTGGAPKKVSTALDPFFRGDPSVYWTGSTIGQDLWADGTDANDVWGDGTNPADRWGDGASLDMRLAYANNRLYCYRKGQSDMFVLDTELNEWAYWDFPLDTHSMVAMQLGGGGPEIMLLGQTTKIVKLDKAATDDVGTAIASKYRSPFINLVRSGSAGVPDQEVTVRETVLDGTGTVSVSLARDWASSLPTTGGGAKTSVALGTSPAVAQGRHRKAQRGRSVSFQIEATSGAWRVEDLTFHLLAPRQPGVKTTS